MFSPNNNIEGILITIIYIILRRKSVILINPLRLNTSTQKPIVLISFRYVFQKILHQCRSWQGFMHQFAVKSHKTREARRWRLNTDVVHHNPHGLCKVILVQIGSDYRLGIADVGLRTSVHLYSSKGIIVLQYDRIEATRGSPCELRVPTIALVIG